MNLFKVLLSFFGFGAKPEINSQQAIPRDDYEYNELKKKKENHLDAILEKIAEKGIESLTRREKEFLDSQSN